MHDEEKITNFFICTATAKNSASTSETYQLNARADENFNAISRNAEILQEL